MSAVSINPADLVPFAEIPDAKASAMIEDALAMATRVAPCIVLDTFAYPEAAKAILRGAILRWAEAGAGGLSQVTSGPFSQTVDTRQNRRGMFWPSEITELASLCQGSSEGKAFSIDTAPVGSGVTQDPYAMWYPWDSGVW